MGEAGKAVGDLVVLCYVNAVIWRWLARARRSLQQNYRSPAASPPTGDVDAFCIDASLPIAHTGETLSSTAR